MTAQLDHVNGREIPPYAEPRFDPIALAKAEAIRTQAEAEAKALRIKAEGEAEAEKIKAAEEARKQKIANDKAEARAREEQAARDARIAKLNREREEQERAAREAEGKAALQEEAEAAKAVEVADAEEQWRKYALRFYAVCSIVALPVQVAAFYNPKALWLMAAPIMLEGGAWVVLKGARAAATGHRPHWHYRLIAWCLAFIAAGINLWHGLNAFDPATAIGTAFASVAGPGVYDLHEHGRIRARDGKLTWRQRWTARKNKRAEAAALAKTEKQQRAETEAALAAAAETGAQLAADRAENFPKVWAHALRLAAALGETTVTEAIWKQAHRDIEGTDPGETVEVIRGRNAAERRLLAARSEAPGKKPLKVNSPQVASQVMPSGSKRVYKPPTRRGIRTKGDTKFHPAARVLASESKRQSIEASRREEQS